MKFVRNFDDLKRFTFEFFDSFLPESLSDKMVNYFLRDIYDSSNIVAQAVAVLKVKPVAAEEAAEYGEVILQLNDYRELLKKYVELLLQGECFEQLCVFLNGIFLQQIGDTKYKSTRKSYTMSEHYFDRFVEIITYCNIQKDLYQPFFAAIFNSEPRSLMFAYKETLNEYLDKSLKKGEDDKFVSKLLSNDVKKTSGEVSQSKDAVKTLKSLIQSYIDGEFTSTSMVSTALNDYPKQSLNIIEPLLNDENENVRYRAINLLLFLYEDKEVKGKVKYLYENTKDEKIKSLLERECNFNPFKKFLSKQEFFDYVDATTLQIQERLYGARLKSYYAKYHLDNTGISGKTLTFVMETFKSRDTDAQLVYLRDYLSYIDISTLNALSHVVFEVALYRNRLLGSKWALRLIALYADDELLNEMTAQLEVWFNNKKDAGVARYFMDLLVNAQREEIIVVAKRLLQAGLDRKQCKFVESKLNDFSKAIRRSVEEVKDKITEDFGFDSEGKMIVEVEDREIQISIKNDCSLALSNLRTGKPARFKPDTTYNNQNFKVYLKDLEKGIKTYKKRLYSSFLEFRKYTPATFEECILSNNLLNFLAQNLIWARYKKDKFIEACLVKNNKLRHLTGNIVYENLDDYQIALLQPSDCQDFKQTIKDMLGNNELLFAQLDFPVYNVSNDLTSNAYSVSSLNGVFCNAQLFITRLQKLKYRINDLDNKGEYSTLYKENKNLNLLTVVEFEKVRLGEESTHSTRVSKITFYMLSKQIKHGKTYNLDKTEAIALKDIEGHILSNEVSLVALACKS